MPVNPVASLMLIFSLVLLDPEKLGWPPNLPG